MPELVNLTPHPIVLRSVEGEDIIIPPSGQIARVSSTPGQDRDMGLPVPVRSAPTYGAIEGLPDPDGNTYIVSGMVLTRVYGRTDVVAPGTGPQDGAIRDPQGRIVAVARFVACEGVGNA